MPGRSTQSLGVMGPSVKVTLDTNTLPAERVVGAVIGGDFDFAIVSVTDRELGPEYAPPKGVARVAEVAVFGESAFGAAVFGSTADVDCFETSLRIISDGSFPPKSSRSALSAGQRRQLRDAMIFCGHVRDGRDIFVTDDLKGFVRGGRREQFEALFNTRIMSVNEFLSEFAGK